MLTAILDQPIPTPKKGAVPLRDIIFDLYGNIGLYYPSMAPGEYAVRDLSAFLKEKYGLKVPACFYDSLAKAGILTKKQTKRYFFLPLTVYSVNTKILNNTFES